MPKFFKFLSGSLFFCGVFLIALLTFEVRLFEDDASQMRGAVACGCLAALINFFNWRLSEHDKRFTQMFWLGFCLLLLGLIILSTSIVFAVICATIGIVLLGYSFKWSPNRLK